MKKFLVLMLALLVIILSSFLNSDKNTPVQMEDDFVVVQSCQVNHERESLDPLSEKLEFDFIRSLLEQAVVFGIIPSVETPAVINLDKFEEFTKYGGDEFRTYKIANVPGKDCFKIFKEAIHAI
ncbi:hypothetical protein KKH36_00825 [Patescibacteria group bacterium]|nr:hypothetical protein [Patescibacteria group bacterium]